MSRSRADDKMSYIVAVRLELVRLLNLDAAHLAAGEGMLPSRWESAIICALATVSVASAQRT